MTGHMMRKILNQKGSNMAKYYVSYTYKVKILFWSINCFSWLIAEYRENITSDQLMIIQDEFENKHKTNNVVILSIIKLDS
jgi:hypothetical protein